MADAYNVAEKTFSEIKRLVAATPFRAFRVRADGQEISVDHPNCIGFHPEVPWLVLLTRTDVFRMAAENVTLIRESHSH